MPIALYYIIAVVATIGLTLTSIFFLSKKSNETAKKILKGVSLFLAAIFIVRYMLSPDAADGVFKLESDIMSSKALLAISLLLVWFDYASIILIQLYPFFKMKVATHLIKWFSSIISVLKLAFLPFMIATIDGGWALNTVSGRGILMAIEVGITIAYCVYIWLKNYNVKIEKKEIFAFIMGIFIIALATMPAYMLQALFGQVNYAVILKKMTLPHRAILYVGVLIPIALYFLLRKLDKEDKRAVLLFIALGTLLSFSAYHKFDKFLQVTSWPFHLCNTAMYIVALCLLFKWEKVFYFTYFINVLGAFLAMAMPNYSGELNLLSSSVVNFYINHYCAFFMPLLIVALKVYDRPKLKQFKYSMVGFGIYFALMLILNSWFSNYADVDYFFINSDFIAEKLGKWAEDTRLIVWEFDISSLHFKFYPLYQVLFFLVYVILGLGVWFVYEGAYSFADTMYDVADRKKKIKLDQLALEVRLAGRSKKEPVNMETKNKLVLKDFSKRYGKSNIYAVKDANLEINGGEIFGFLGHNGAGKSTIIKSIVGIQPITSGSIEVCGYDVDTQSIEAKKQIGYVPDHYALYEKHTGREYINYIADLYNVSKEDRDKSIERYVKLFELEDSFDNQIKTYSHGMKQKIAIMSALVHNPRVWILDEPLTGLDPQSIFQVKECMREHAKKGNIVFFSSHLIDIVEQLCDRIAIIKLGHILTTASVKEVEKEMSLEKFYLDVTENAKVKRVVDKDVKDSAPLTREERKAARALEKEQEKQEKLAKKAAKAAKRQEKAAKKQERQEKDTKEN